jgi:hypothetical protein
MGATPSLEQATKELAAREPIFHHPEFGTTRADFERMTDESFWEVGASGRVYSREYVLDTLADRHRTRVEENWVVSGFACRPLAQDLFLATYQLEQDRGRLSRRATLWRFTAGGWKVLYHQGTLIPAA